jgi:nicotinate dehydrogenase subunit B
MPEQEIPGFEYERYELHSAPTYSFIPDRRDFFKLIGGGLVVLLALRSEAGAQESGGARGGGQSMPQDIGAWMHIGESGTITVYTGKVEMGQNIRTSLAQAVGEELRTNPSRIELVMGDTMLTPYDFGTVGSMTTPLMAPQLHKVAAAAREMLLDLAAEQWKADRSALLIEDGRVRNENTNVALSFGELTKGQKLTRTITTDARVTPATEWKIEGRDLRKVNARALVTGKEKFTSDLKLPGMLHGRVVRPSAFKADLVSVDTAPARKMPGVVAVHDGNFVGVAADDSAKLDTAAAAVRVEWKSPQQTNSGELYAYLKTQAREQPQWKPVESDVHVEAVYSIPYIAHTPLETRSAVAQWEGDRLTVWSGGQRDRSAHWLRLRRQAYRGMRCGSGSSRQSRRGAGQASVDPRR